MTIGLWFVLLSLLSFAGMGVLHKLGDRLECNSLYISLFTMGSSCLITTTMTMLRGGADLASTPTQVMLVALPFGISAAVALWIFQKGLRFGRIATSWLLINLSSAVPTILSVLIYHEPLSIRKMLVLVLVVASLLLLWWDRRQQLANASGPSTQLENAVPVDVD